MKGLSISMVTTSSHSYTHIHPVDTIPKSLDINYAVDNTGTLIFGNIHKYLFCLKGGMPIPDLIDDFWIKNGKIYRIILKDIKFHSGSSLDFSDVQHSLETAIKTKTICYEKLSGIIGYDDFVAGRSKHLEGLKGLKGSRNFEIEIEEPDPLFQMKLSSPYFAIVPSTGPNTIGLGAYALESISDDMIVLKHSDKNRKIKKGVPKFVKCIYATKSDAIRRLKKGEVHDLMSYPIDEREAKEVDSIVRTKTIFTPRFYFLAISSRAINNQSDREALFSKIDRKQIIDNCFPGNSITDNIAPKEHFGHDSELRLNFSDKNDFFIDQEVSINIANGIGSEECLKKQLTEMLSPYCEKLVVSIANTSSRFDDWREGKLTMLLTYYQPYTSLDYFHIFNPSTNFTVGDHEDQETEQLIKTSNLPVMLTEKFEMAKKVNRQILKRSTVLPFFNSKNYVAYSNRYKKIDDTIPAFDIKFEDLILDTN